jgi:predicted phage terminase large subunit-like protein
MSQKTTGDYTVLQLWGRDSVDLNSNYYLVDQIRGKWDADELLTRAQAFYSKANALQKNLRCSALCVEARANGLVLLQQLRRRKIPVIELEASRDKILRAQDALPTIASGYVLLPRGAEFLSDLLREIEAFPASDHDDQVDAMVYAINDRQLTVDLAATL